MKKIWEVFPRLTEVIRFVHREHEMHASGHNFDHALQVAQCAFLIAESEEVARLAGAAGLCHNADRIIQKLKGVGKKEVPDGDVVALMTNWLIASGEFGDNNADIFRIQKAVLRHSGPNRDDGDDVLVALQDADRITCSMADTLMAAAQFFSELPPIDPKWLTYDPSAHSYRNPKSVLKNQECRLDWFEPGGPFCVRLPKAKALMARRIAYVRGYLREVEEQRVEIGLWPDYPFEL